jgi:hypothetical protein
VIQLGDVVDRGPHGHTIIEFFRVVAEEAAREGGEFIQLLGNHELLNLQGDPRFVNPQVFAAFGSKEHWREAFSPIGEYGSWLKNLPAAVIKNQTLFVHAGILPEYARMGVDDLNRAVREAIENHLTVAPILLDNGPMWTRQVIYPALKGDCAALEESLRILSELEIIQHRHAIKRMVVGHTIMQTGAITPLCGGRLIAADIAVSQYMLGGGHLGILELRNGENGLYPYIQYPSQPFRQHPFPEVQLPLWTNRTSVRDQQSTAALRSEPPTRPLRVRSDTGDEEKVFWGVVVVVLIFGGIVSRHEKLSWYLRSRCRVGRKIGEVP